MRIAPLRRRIFGPVLFGVLALPVAAAAAPHKESSSETVKDDATDEPKEFRFEFGLTGGITGSTRRAAWAGSPTIRPTFPRSPRSRSAVGWR